MSEWMTWPHTHLCPHLLQTVILLLFDIIARLDQVHLRVLTCRHDEQLLCLYSREERFHLSSVLLRTRCVCDARKQSPHQIEVTLVYQNYGRALPLISCTRTAHILITHTLLVSFSSSPLSCARVPCTEYSNVSINFSAAILTHYTRQGGGRGRGQRPNLRPRCW